MGYLILANAYYQEAGKSFLLGIFDRLRSPEFPCVHGRMHLAAEIIGPPGEERELTLTLQDSASHDLIPPIALTGKFSNYGGLELHVDIASLTFPKPGFYRFAVSEGGTPIGGRDLYVEPTMENSR